MASRRAFVISVAPNSTVSVPLLYASHCSSICVRPRENKDEEDHSFSEAAMFREFNMKMMHAMPSSSGVARDCRPFHVSTSIRREKLRSHIVLSAPIVLRNVLPVVISYVGFEREARVVFERAAREFLSYHSLIYITRISLISRENHSNTSILERRYTRNLRNT